MTNTLLRAGTLACALMTTTCLTAPAVAQTTATGSPSVRPAFDDNGVNVISGSFERIDRGVAIGDPAQGGLAFQRIWTGRGWYHNLFGIVSGTGSTRTVRIGQTTERFTNVGGVYTSDDGSGATLAISGGFVYTAADGTIATFAGSSALYNGVAGPVLSTLTRPDGTRLTFTYKTQIWRNEQGQTGGSVIRLQSVTSNTGYMIKFTYEANPTILVEGVVEAWRNIVSVTGINNAVDYCDPAADSCASLTQTWPQATVSANVLITTATDQFADNLGNTSTGTMNDSNGTLTNVRSPADASNDYALTYDGFLRVATYASGGGTWTYSYSDSAGQRTTTVAQPLGGNRVYVSNLASSRLLSFTDELGRTTSYQYDSFGRRTRTTAPEGNYVQLTYDARGNVTESRAVAKSGSGLADIVTTAAFPSTCTVAVTCNQPTSTTDARGNTTDYTYDSTHGGPLTVTAPAPSSGATRPQTRFSYTPLSAYYRTSASSGIVAGPSAIYRPIQVSTCQTGAAPACVGTADEVRVTMAYGPQSAGTANNLLRVSQSAGAGDASLTATVAQTYDVFGNVLTVDGPLAGADDTTRYRYDTARRMIGMAGPDPDGAGALQHRARRVTYNGDSNVTRTEDGTVASQSDGAWAAFSPLEATETSFDALGRPVAVRRMSGSTVHALVQTSYDARGRAQCSVTRMNPAVFGSAPGACTLGTEGSHGPDRISRTTYDNANQVTLVETGYGVSGVAANEVASAYTNNGQVETLTDAEGNRTTYVYDGHDRLSRTRMPDPSTDNTSSTTDYEELTYDLAGNVTNRRLRDGQNVALTYDDLNRPTVYNIPQSYAWDTDFAYTYDNLGRVVTASDSNGHAYTLGYDALGRLLSETSNWYGALAASQYDLAGRRTRLTHRDGFYVTHDHLVTGEVSAIRENGATSGAGVLATYAYDNLGRRTSLTRGNGTVTNYSYDAVSRLSLVSQDLAGTGADLNLWFGHNPASQIVSRAGAHGSYAYTAHANQNVTDTVNGLNQLTQTGSTSLSHDGRGNITGIGGAGYTYAADNRLLAAPGTTLAYDPLGRLFGESGEGLLFHYDGQRQILETDNVTDAIQRRYVHGPGVDEPLVWYEGSGTSDRRWFHADERGSIIAISNASGNATAINAYDDYGRPQSLSGAGVLDGRFGYTGQAWLPELGMYYYRARVYNSDRGRFMQTDPIGYQAGMNLYAYVQGDPVNFTDPSGLSDCFFGDLAENDIPVCGRRERGVIITGESTYGNPTLGRLEYGGGGGAPDSGGRPAGDRRNDVCARARQEPGEIEIASSTIEAFFVLGFTRTSGEFRNVLTGTVGNFVSYGLGVGIGAGGGRGGGRFRVMSDFLGFSDNLGGSISIGPVSAGAWRSTSVTTGERIGSGGGIQFGWSPGSIRGLSASLSGTMTETTISDCSYRP